MEKYLQEGLLALVPVYDQHCQARVVTLKESHLEERSVKWLINNLALFYSLNLAHLRKRYGAILNIKHHIAIPIESELVMLPLKLRRARIPGDVTMGYVSMLHIAGVGSPPGSEEGGAGKEEEGAGDGSGPWLSVITFKNGLSIKTLNRPEKVKERLKQGEVARSDFLKLRARGPLPRGLSSQNLVSQIPDCDCFCKDLVVGLILPGTGKDLKRLPHS